MLQKRNKKLKTQLIPKNVIYMKRKYFFMAILDQLRRNQILICKISLLLTILITPVLIMSIQMIQIDDESSSEGFDTQIPRESYVYYEETTGWSLGVYVSGDYAYIADGTSGLAVMNISDPTNPREPEYKPTTGDAYGIYVSGD